MKVCTNYSSIFFFKQKTAYEMRISDWSSDVCSSDLQTVLPIDLFDSGASAIVPTHLDRDYWLPAVTVTWEMAPDMQLRASGSRTIARPQFRELVAQVYQDPESNRLFRGNPSLTDTQLWTAEARYDNYFGRDHSFSHPAARESAWRRKDNAEG